MLNEDDRKKLAFLNHLVLEQEKDISRDEVKWLLGRLRASLSRPDEFDFPEFAGLINPMKKNAYALRRSLKPNWTKTMFVAEASTGNGAEVFSVSAECLNTNAFLLVRPWIRAHSKMSDEAFEKLRLCSLSLMIDGVMLLQDSPIDDYLIAMDGGGMRAASPGVRAPNEYVYPAVELNTSDATADPYKPLGVFLPDKTMVRLFLRTPPGHTGWEEAQIVAGFTVSEYTTRAEGGGAELEMPRDFVKLGS